MGGRLAKRRSPRQEHVLTHLGERIAAADEGVGRSPAVMEIEGGAVVDEPEAAVPDEEV
jgi:hypothetical protein